MLAEYGISVAMLRVKAREIQDDEIGNIAEASALEATDKTRLPVIAEDAGLFVDALNGFPGPYSKYVLHTVGKEGILKLLESRGDRKARFKSAVAFSSPDRHSKRFLGVVEGSISESIRGSGGFGFDPIFIPAESPHRTFAEMTIQEKNKFSHRGRALRKFAEWYKHAP